MSKKHIKSLTWTEFDMQQCECILLFKLAFFCLAETNPRAVQRSLVLKIPKPPLAPAEAKSNLQLHSNPPDRAFREEDGQPSLERNYLRLFALLILHWTVVPVRLRLSRRSILDVVVLYERRRENLLVVTITEAGIQNDVRHQFYSVQSRYYSRIPFHLLVV